MPPIEFTFFSITLFLALVALLEWKRRRTVVRERMSRGLRGFVASMPPADEHDEAETGSLLIAQ